MDHILKMAAAIIAKNVSDGNASVVYEFGSEIMKELSIIQRKNEKQRNRIFRPVIVKNKGGKKRV